MALQCFEYHVVQPGDIVIQQVSSRWAGRCASRHLMTVSTVRRWHDIAGEQWSTVGVAVRAQGPSRKGLACTP